MSEKVYPGDTEGGCQEMKKKIGRRKIRKTKKKTQWSTNDDDEL